MNNKRVYVAGPMRGIKFYNFPAFDHAAQLLRKDGYDVVSPADLDRSIGFDPLTMPEDFDWNSIPESLSLNGCIQRDIEAICGCHGIFMLDGWQKSVGASAEYALAKWRKMDIFFQTDPAILARQQHDSNAEVRVTDPNTGGQKGVKLARFDLIPPDPLWRLAEHYGKGAAKYSDDNYRKGYSWRLSIGALQRHLHAFLLGEPIDAETGSHHLTAVIWHAIALQEFERLGLGTDDRYCTIDANTSERSESS